MARRSASAAPLAGLIYSECQFVWPHDAVELRKELDAAFAGDGSVVVEAIVDSREYDSVVLKKDKP